ncbi:hypothetical protein V0U79_12460 [Hyphobacterium sp. HN65]|uniref:Response regulatory domain-containing protein n=1 Tax=Hyphobacterium lacteum TaxID=3116575 RepID=A0ABU7LTF8_9PROT|nr:hypothetical protein [Hyphobacterium sp. HN65]MEE2527181.1 hypothetical protein [Hyphobacterium sp. HN65]
MKTFSGSLDMSVLICSSSRPLQQSLEALLGAMGCKIVSGADTTASAREQLASQHHDLALIDDSFKASRNDLSALPVPALRLSCEPCGNEPELTKPFRPADLAESMLACVQRPAGNALAASS